MTKERLMQHYQSWESFYAKYFDQHKRQANGEWKVKCPFHEDKTPSMSINMQTGMFNCFGCGKKGSAFDFYMAKHGVSFPEAVAQMCRSAGITDIPHSSQAQKAKEVKKYDYHDAAGNVVTQTIRYDPKNFKQRARVDGKFVWSLKGVKTVLYRLPEVLRADQILVVEGEKDCDTAKDLGIVATTCPMGAGKWRPEYTETLAGKNIVLVADCDGPGIKHMAEVGKALNPVSRVRWLEFPGQNPKGFDLSDFVAGFDNEFEAMKQVDAIIRSARLFDEKNIIIQEPDTPESDRIKSWIQASPGEFSVRDLDYDLGFTGVNEKESRTKILEKFVAEKIISREGKRRGVYRPYQSDLKSLDYLSPDDSFLEIWLPLGMHKKVGIMPGNIIVLAGEANSGKTALMLNIIKSNMNKFDVHYFNSEMGPGELKSRLTKFEGLTLEGWNFNAYERDRDFADVIFSGENSLNIIDFLEVHDEFYLVGEKIKQIHSALNGGVAIIAIQKNKGAEFGVGGNRTMEKARLVVNVEPGKCKITKAKNFINPGVNPNGWCCDWKLVNGCQFVLERSGWYYEQKKGKERF